MSGLETKLWTPTDEIDPASLLLKIETSEGDGYVEALPSITGNVDSDGDIIEPGAYKLSRPPFILLGHQWVEQSLIGKTTDWAELPPGDDRLPDDLKAAGYGALWVATEFNLRKQAAAEAFSDLQFHGALGWSIGYVILGKRAPNDDEKARSARRILTAIDIPEASPVILGANRGARTLVAKSDTPTDPDPDGGDDRLRPPESMVGPATAGLIASAGVDVPGDLVDLAKSIADRRPLDPARVVAMKTYFDRYRDEIAALDDDATLDVDLARQWALHGGDAGDDWTKGLDVAVADLGDKMAPISGSYEQRQEAVREAVDVWAGEQPHDADYGAPWAYLVGTFEDRVVFSLSINGERSAWQADYSIDSGGDVTLDDPVEVEIEAVVSPKADEPDDSDDDDDDDDATDAPPVDAEALADLAL